MAATDAPQTRLAAISADQPGDAQITGQLVEGGEQGWRHRYPVFFAVGPRRMRALAGQPDVLDPRQALRVADIANEGIHAFPELGQRLESADIDGDDGIAGIVLATKQHLGFALLDVILEQLQALLQLAGGGVVYLGEIEEDFDVADEAGVQLGGLNRPLESCPLLECLLGECLVLPEVRCSGALFEPGQFCLLRFDVKETSGVQRPLV